MTDAPLIWHGRLCRPWNPGKPTRAGAYVPPFYDVLDFDSYRLMGREKTERVHVTYPDHYALLGQILARVTAAFDPMPAETLINSRMPSVVRVPSEFFGRNLLFINNPMIEARRLAQQGTSVLVIEEQFLRHTVEAADNSLTLTWFNAPHKGQRLLDELAVELHFLGILPEQGCAA